MKIYVIHYAKLIERRKNMVMQLITNNLEAEFVTQYDRDTITEEEKNSLQLVMEEQTELLHYPIYIVIETYQGAMIMHLF